MLIFLQLSGKVHKKVIKIAEPIFDNSSGKRSETGESEHFLNKMRG